MSKHITQEDVHAQEHDELIQQVRESGLPMWMLDYYEETHQPLNEKESTKNLSDDALSDLNF